MQMRGFIGVLYIVAEWLMRIAVANLLWCIVNIPIIYIALSLFLVEMIGELVQVGILITILLPFFFFPASTALVDLFYQWVIQKKDISIIRPFLQSLKNYYVKSMLGGIVLTVIWLIFIVDFYYFARSGLVIVEYFLYLLMIFLIVVTLYFFSVIVHSKEKKVFVILKQALISTISRPFLSFALAVISMIAVYISVNILTFLLPLFLGSFIALISCLAFHYTLHVKKEEE